MHPKLPKPYSLRPLSLLGLVSLAVVALILFITLIAGHRALSGHSAGVSGSPVFTLGVSAPGRTGTVKDPSHKLISLIMRGIGVNAGKIPAPKAIQGQETREDMAHLTQSDWFARVKKDLQKQFYYIAPDRDHAGYGSANLAQGLQAGYTARTFSLHPLASVKTLVAGEEAAAGSWQLDMQITGVYGDGESADLLQGTASVSQTQNNIEYTYGKDLTVQYHNDDKGVRQNFIIGRAPAAHARELKVSLQLGEGWVASRSHDRELHFALRNKMGGLDRKIIYNDLKAWDAEGKPLLARMEANGRDGRFSIIAHVENAAYPVTIDPVSSSAANTYNGTNADDNLGSSVASAGDVNGDGYSDVLVGAYGQNELPSASFTSGYVNLYLGGIQGLSASPAVIFTGEQVGDKFGGSVASAGDINGDGFSDIVIGAPRYSVNFPTDPTITKEGRAYVFMGSASLGSTPGTISASSAAAIFTGEQNESYLGYSVASAGDVNKDGYSDLMLGSFGYGPFNTPGSPANNGVVYLYNGSVSGISSAATPTRIDHVIDGESFGKSIAGIGDINNDGFADILIGAPTNGDQGDGDGAAYLYLGGSSFSTTPVSTIYAPDATPNPTSGDDFGISVAGAGDVNSDGYADFVISADTKVPSLGVSGQVYVYSGQSSVPSPYLPATILNNSGTSPTPEAMGVSVACAGDVNGDGFSDILVGSPGVSSDVGYAILYFGSSSGIHLADSIRFASTILDDKLGVSVASAGDINGDGYSDFLVGANKTINGALANAGSTYLFTGGPKGANISQSFAMAAPSGSTGFGFSAASAGDVNADGYNDVIVGAADAAGSFPGSAYLFLGSSSGLPAAPSATLVPNSGPAGSDLFALSVTGLGDINGDSYEDVAVGAPGSNSQAGAAYIYYGSASISGSIAPSVTLAGTTAGDGFGAGIAGVGDVNGDGYKDLVIGAPTPFGTGKVYFIPGTSTALSTTLPAPIASPASGTLFGSRIAGAGDVNGDGFSDALVSAPTLLGNGGAVYLLTGSATGLSTTVPAGITVAGSKYFGIGISTAGDVDGDGFDDIIIGDNGVTANKGIAYIYTGSSSGLSSFPAATLNSPNAGLKFGTSVSSLGDINGDGYSDVIVGAPGTGTANGESDIFTGSPTVSSIPGNITTLTGANSGGRFGTSVAGVGDVNGDGYSDVFIGESLATGNGASSLYYGNDPMGKNAVLLQHLHNKSNQLRLYESTDLNAPIKADNVGSTQFGLGLFVQPPYAHAKARLVWETVGNGVAFSGSPYPITNSVVTSGRQTGYTDINPGGTELKTLITKVTGTLATKVRVRVEYAPTTFSAGQVYGPWIYTQALSSGTSTGVVLPLDWVSVSAQTIGEDIQVNWKTENEKNTRSFIVETKTDPNAAFEAIGTVAAKGNNEGGISSYSFTDIRPAVGTHYYRLRQVDINGRYTYSIVVSAVIGGSGTVFKVYPNPTTDLLTVTLPANGSTAGQQILKVYNLSGVIVKQVVLNNSSITTISMGSLSKGVYFVQLNNGSDLKQVVVK